MIEYDDFPGLNESNHRITSPATVVYNCVAWAAEDVNNWYEPGRHWPGSDVMFPEYGLGVLEQLFLGMGYQDSGNPLPEKGFDKIAIYGSGALYTHAARQLPSGKWTSKLGKGVDIEHDSPDDLVGELYGEVMQILKRATPG